MPTTPGAYDLVIAVTDTTSGQSAQTAFPLTISPLITLTSTITSAQEGAAVSGATITASGPAGLTYTFSATGNVPPGLSITQLGPDTAALTGTPTDWGATH